MIELASNGAFVLKHFNLGIFVLATIFLVCGIAAVFQVVRSFFLQNRARRLAVLSALCFLFAGLVIVFRTMWFTYNGNMICGSALSSFLKYPGPGTPEGVDVAYAACRRAAAVNIVEGLIVGTILAGLGAVAAIAARRQRASTRATP
jgi:uncharacterized membrane protein